MPLYLHNRDGRILARVHPWDKYVGNACRSAGGEWHDYAKGYTLAPDRRTVAGLMQTVRAMPGTGDPHVDVDVKAWLAGGDLSLWPRGALADRAATVRPTEAAMADVAARLAKVLPPGRVPLPYQIAGVTFLELAGGRALLADGMGLGKTVQALCLLALHPEWAPALVVCPASVRVNWVRESQRWLPDPWTVAALASSRDPWPDASLVVVTYDVAANVARTLEEQKDDPLTPTLATLKATRWETVVADEAHRTKNWQAARTRAVRGLGKRAAHFVALTGTPIITRPLDLHGALKTVAPTFVPDKQTFGIRYANGMPRKMGDREWWTYDGLSNVGELRELMAGLALRRVKDDVLRDLPPKRRVTVPLVVPAAEYRATEAAVLRDAMEAAQQQAADRAAARAAAGYTDADPLDPAAAAALMAVGKLWQAVGMMKAPAVADWVADYAEGGGPLLVFYHHREVGDLLADRVKDEGVRWGRIDGSVTGEARAALVDALQAGTLDVLLLSTKAAGEGITLTRATDVAFAERDWTAAAEEQAEDRAHRYGLDHPLTVWYWRLEADDGKATLDTDMADMVEDRRRLPGQVFGDGGLEATADTTLQVEAARRVLARVYGGPDGA